MSGYTNSAVLDSKYQQNIRGYYINRILKIYPPYIVIMALTLLILGMSEDPTVLIPCALQKYSAFELLNEVLGGVLTTNGLLVFNGFPTIVPQAWTNSVEIFFYITAPIIVGLHKKKKKVFYGIVFGSTLFPLISFWVGADFPTYRYRCIFGSYFLFLIGSIIYFELCGRKYFKHPNMVKYAGIVIYIVSFAIFKELREMHIWASILLFVIIILACIQTTSTKIDAILGRLSGGVYISHFFCRAIIYYSSNKSESLKHIWGIGTPQYVCWMFFLSIFMSMIIYWIIERPIDKIRRIVYSSKKKEGAVRC